MQWAAHLTVIGEQDSSEMKKSNTDLKARFSK
jgi:hypothetical protein